MTWQVAGTYVDTARDLLKGVTSPAGPADGPSQRRAVAGYLVSMDEPASSLGEIIRRQRELSRLSMRQFAGMAGISNPYLSQIERGLREPSERVVDAIARSLETSADALYEQAGLVADDDEVSSAVRGGDRGRPGADASPATGPARRLRGASWRPGPRHGPASAARDKPTTRSERL